jgi:phytoene synthase
VTEDLDTLVRRVDEDRWLASRFGPHDVRKRLIALYAVNYEIARLAETVREPGLGAIKLQWWRDAIAEVFSGGQARPLPALQALKQAVQEAPLSEARFQCMIEARQLDFEAKPFNDPADFSEYINDTAGELMRLAIEACGVEVTAGAIQSFVATGAQRWAATGMLRSEPVWRARGRDLSSPGQSSQSLFERLRAGSGASRQLSRGLPAEVFPAVGYVALVPAYLGRTAVRQNLPLLERQVRLVIASATGLF